MHNSIESCIHTLEGQIWIKQVIWIRRGIVSFAEKFLDFELFTNKIENQLKYSID